MTVAERDALVAAARAAVTLSASIVRDRMTPLAGNAPGHCHVDPPHWDHDGSVCRWCAVEWPASVSALRALAEPDTSDDSGTP